MIYSILVIVQVVVALSLVGLILLQHGKGADAGAAFGSGASGTVFGAQGSANFMSRATAGLATVFFAISLTLAYLINGASVHSGSVTDQLTQPAKTAPAQPAANAPAQGPTEGATTESGNQTRIPSTGEPPSGRNSGKNDSGQNNGQSSQSSSATHGQTTAKKTGAGNQGSASDNKGGDNGGHARIPR